MRLDRRTLIKTSAVGMTAAVAGCLGDDDDDGDGVTNGNGVDEVSLGVIAPLSGPFSFNGSLVLEGVEFAAQQINDDGGIDALGGAEFEVESVDTEETTDQATTAAQDLYSAHDVTASLGSWLSSHTIATTGVSEREQVPHLTLSFSDEIFDRGFEYVFGTSPLSSEFGQGALDQSIDLAEAVGDSVDKVALVGDNTAAISFAFDPMAETLIPERDGVELVAEEVWSPPLPDASPVISALQSEEPDVVYFGATAFEDAVQVLRGLNEADIQVPLIGIGAWLTVPPYIENVGVELTEGLIALTGSHPTNEQEQMVRDFIDFSGEPFMVQDSVSHYAHVYMIKEAIEQTGSADPGDIREFLANETITEGPAVDTFIGDELSFDDTGHMEQSALITSQWSESDDVWDFIETDAAPFTVFPEDLSVKDVDWQAASYP